MSKGRKKATAEYLDARRSEILGRLNARKLDEAGGRLRTSGISAGRIKEGLIPPTLKEAALLEILIVGVKKYLKNPKIVLSAINPSSPVHQNRLRYGFHILNREAFLSTIFYP
jgi:hypothetical protein